jgi:cation transport ATPase
MLSAVAMAASDLIVIGNALRLQRGDREGEVRAPIPR